MIIMFYSYYYYFFSCLFFVVLVVLVLLQMITIIKGRCDHCEVLPASERGHKHHAHIFPPKVKRCLAWSKVITGFRSKAPTLAIIRPPSKKTHNNYYNTFIFPAHSSSTRSTPNPNHERKQKLRPATALSSSSSWSLGWIGRPPPHSPFPLHRPPAGTVWGGPFSWISRGWMMVDESIVVWCPPNVQAWTIEWRWTIWWGPIWLGMAYPLTVTAIRRKIDQLKLVTNRGWLPSKPSQRQWLCAVEPRSSPAVWGLGLAKWPWQMVPCVMKDMPSTNQTWRWKIRWKLAFFNRRVWLPKGMTTMDEKEPLVSPWKGRGPPASLHPGNNPTFWDHCNDT